MKTTDRGVYRLKRTERQRNEGLVTLLLACPVKGWFAPMDRAATALEHDLAVATRNSAEFRRAGVRVVDPGNVDGPEPGAEVAHAP